MGDRAQGRGRGEAQHSHIESGSVASLTGGVLANPGSYSSKEEGAARGEVETHLTTESLGAALLGAHEPLRIGRQLSGADGSWTVVRTKHFGNGTHRVLASSLRGLPGVEIWAILIWNGFGGSYRIEGMPVNRDHAEALYEERPCPHCGLEFYLYETGCYDLLHGESPVRDQAPDLMDVIRASEEAALGGLLGIVLLCFEAVLR